MIKKLFIVLAISLIAVVAITCNINPVKNEADEFVPTVSSEIKIEKKEGIKDIVEPEKEEISEIPPSYVIPEEKNIVCDETKKDEVVPPEILQPDKIEEPVSDNAETETELECTLSVKCDTVLNNMLKLYTEKVEVIPENGIIFPETKVEFYEGESAFNILSREMKKNKIHIDFETTPMYNTVYIKGISNLYEFDCGELSGWLYKINGKIQNYGCSQYILKPGDKVEFLYTCDMGKDISY